MGHLTDDHNVGFPVFPFKVFNPLQPGVSYLYPLRTSDLKFPDVFRSYRSATPDCNGLIIKERGAIRNSQSERERQRDRERDRETDRERQTERDRENQRQRESERERERIREREASFCNSKDQKRFFQLETF